jgi:hypothetical protein
VASEATHVTLHAPQLGGREAFTVDVLVAGDRVTEAEAMPFIVGWHADSLRKFCKSVGWAATRKEPPAAEPAPPPAKKRKGKSRGK